MDTHSVQINHKNKLKNRKAMEIKSKTEVVKYHSSGAPGTPLPGDGHKTLFLSSVKETHWSINIPSRSLSAAFLSKQIRQLPILRVKLMVPINANLIIWNDKRKKISDLLII